MRRGFKTKAKELAAEVRDELELGVTDPLDPYQLARLYGIRVYQLQDRMYSLGVRQHFGDLRPATFSGALVNTGNCLVIIENLAHAPVRCRSTMAHEMGHVLLEHQFGALLLTDEGCRAHDREQEEEADEVGAELLIPSAAAVRLARQHVPDQQVALMYQVSVDYARWRMYATGARTIARRSDARRRKPA